MIAGAELREVCVVEIFGRCCGREGRSCWRFGREGRRERYIKRMVCVRSFAEEAR